MNTTTERTSGLYAFLEASWVYDFAQWLVRSRRSRQRFFQRHVEFMPGQRLLDIGCGTASVLSHLPNVDYVGVDIRSKYLRTAQRRFPSASFYCGEVDKFLTLNKPEPFNRVLALGVLHHLDDATALCVMQAAARVLDAQGRWVSHDPTYTSQQSAAARWVVNRDRGRYVRTPEQLLELAKSCFTRCRVEIESAPLRIPYTEAVLIAEL